MDPSETGLRGDDPYHWGHSLANFGELLLPLLDRAQVGSIAEIGAYAGDLSSVLVEWAEGADAEVMAIDPVPQPELIALAERSRLTLVQETSERALADLELPDTLVIDGDHNYYAVRGELQRIAELSPPGGLPLLLLHDVCWPHARRDAYYAPERIPSQHRQPITEGAGLFPGEKSALAGGIPCKWAATREGGERNGVLTALEDFLEGQEGLRFAIVPAFFGLGVVWEESAAWADSVSELLEPWVGNKIVARLEANRVHLLSSRHRLSAELGAVSQREQLQAKLLTGLAESRLFRIADRLSYLRHRHRGNSWRAQIDRALAGGE